jgi:hypothetical protein
MRVQACLHSVSVQNGHRLLLRGKQQARAQWRYHCAVHNLLKLHRAGSHDLIREPNGAGANPSAAKRRSRTTLSNATRAFAASLRDSPADRLLGSASTVVTDPGS